MQFASLLALSIVSARSLTYREELAETDHDGSPSTVLYIHNKYLSCTYDWVSGHAAGTANHTETARRKYAVLTYGSQPIDRPVQQPEYRYSTWVCLLHSALCTVQ